MYTLWDNQTIDFDIKIFLIELVVETKTLLGDKFAQGG